MIHVLVTVLTFCHAGLIKQHSPLGKDDDYLSCKSDGLISVLGCNKSPQT